MIRPVSLPYICDLHPLVPSQPLRVSRVSSSSKRKHSESQCYVEGARSPFASRAHRYEYRPSSNLATHFDPRSIRNGQACDAVSHNDTAAGRVNSGTGITLWMLVSQCPGFEREACVMPHSWPEGANKPLRPMWATERANHATTPRQEQRKDSSRCGTVVAIAVHVGYPERS